MAGYPTRFERSPLAEAVFEMRFAVGGQPGVETLPFLIHAALGDAFPRLEQLPVAALPREIRDKTAELRYAALVKLQGENEAVLLGDRVVTFSATKPYPGWKRFRSRAAQIAAVLRHSGKLPKLERYSLKYINLIDPASAHDPTAPFTFVVNAPARLEPTGFRLRFETRAKGFLTIVECASNASTVIGSERLQGTMLVLDTVMEPADDGFFNDIERRLDAAHDVLEGFFFELLAKDAVDAMGPSYDQPAGA